MNSSNKKLNSSRGLSVQNSQRGMITESVFEKKFKTFVEKSLHTISDIRSSLDRGVTPPDGDEDMSRRIVRVKEFSNRFSRNYLYPLARQMDSLTKLTSQSANLHHQLLSAYHVILNGLQAYHNHLPTSIGTCSSEKLKVILKRILELCDIHSTFIKQPDENGFSDFVTTYKLNAELTLQKIEDHFNAVSSDSILKSVTTKISLPGYTTSNTNKTKTKSKKNAIEARLSMYSVTAAFRKDPQWKKAVDAFARKKLNVKSRYKTAAYRHRPPIEKGSQMLALPSKCKLFGGKRSTAVLKRTPRYHASGG
ncbi:hypothetical protein NQ314_008258 [Rhamnusium bicolor]|uniref:Uncharacterized protein n=1 Tax=Rhamnusium bicolor TaxID=1586634 RepID=A0AAV8YD80_9CUCU|nr:hypothetical protein NQ314_008258 [Rhamnusium bicolor]